MITILGIDPGSIITGFGIVKTDGARSFHVDHGHISLGNGDFNLRLGQVHLEIAQLLSRWNPDEVAIEQVFVSKNAMSALKLGQARGAAIATVVAANLPVFEYTPRTIKKAVTGTGSAPKQQVQTMIGQLLSLKEELQNDAADGLAIALCHAHSRGIAGAAGAGGTNRPRRRRSARPRSADSAVAGASAAVRSLNRNNRS